MHCARFLLVTRLPRMPLLLMPNRTEAKVCSGMTECDALLFTHAKESPKVGRLARVSQIGEQKGRFKPV